VFGKGNMLRNRKPARLFSRRQLLMGAAGSALAVPVAKIALASSGSLVVGGLPVTCNLTLPVACSARSALAAKSGTSSGCGCASPSAGGLFEYSKYNGWPEIKESLMAGRIQAAFMLAPLVMDLVAKKIPIKIVALGHRSGAVIMVRTDSPCKTFKDLTGKRIAIPSRFAVDFLFLRKMLKKEGMAPGQVELVEMPPPDMPAALYAKAVDAYCTGEPFGAAAQRAGYAVPLSMTRDEWRNYICCCLTVRQELIKSNPELLQELVNHILGAGVWLDQSPAHRTRAAEIASTRAFFNQDKRIIDFVMQNPHDRVTYGDLRMIKEEFDELMQLSVDAQTLKQPIAYERYVDDSFARVAVPARIVV
jgi:NitT/TauT family transport system substrate-binding protein